MSLNEQQVWRARPRPEVGRRQPLVAERVPETVTTLAGPEMVARTYSSDVSRDFLLVIGDRKPLAWILTEGLMAFSGRRSREARQLSEGDRLFLYTTRNCFHYPNRDRGRIIGQATITSPVSTSRQPVEFGDRVFPLRCSLDIMGLATRNTGPDVAELVPYMHLFRGANSRSWGVYLRRVLVPLDRHDASLIDKRLAPLMHPVREVRNGYVGTDNLTGSAAV